MNQEQSLLRKAAILLACLETELADQLIDQLNQPQASKVRHALQLLGNTDPDERNQILEEFFHSEPPKSTPESPVEQEGNLPGSANYTGITQNEDNSGKPLNEAKPFCFLSTVELESLVPFLEKERPQTIVVILSHLPHKQAVELLSTFRSDLQVDVLQRLSDLDKVDIEIAQTVERELKIRIDEQRRTSERQSVGLNTVTNILSAADDRQRKTLLNNLRRHQNRLAGKITVEQQDVSCNLLNHSINDFNDFVHLDSAALKIIFREADPELFPLALAGTTSDLATHLLDQLPKHSAYVLQQKINRLGPTRLSDVDKAQSTLVQIVEQLEHNGEIHLGPTGLPAAA